MRLIFNILAAYLNEVISLGETVDILGNKKLVSQILKSEIERKAGKVISERKLLKELGISSIYK